MKITDRLHNKNILIWGYGREGKSTEHFIRQFCEVKNLEIFEGTQEQIDESAYDLIIKSPGIKVERYGENYTSQTELFLGEFAGQTIGITGTKGKSTTSTLLYTVLSRCLDRKVLLMGNMGKPCLDYYGQIDGDTVVVYEMSCHQLAHTEVSPHIAIFLNLFEEHLDYYGTLEKYFAAKKNITLHQGEQDYFFCGEQVPYFETRAQRRVIPRDPELSFETRIPGAHNQMNAAFVYSVCKELFGCGEEEIREAIRSFTGLPHRLEYVASVGGVDYYDDSISTSPEATIQALESIPNAKTVIIGGMDRHIHYDLLTDYIRKHDQYEYLFAYASGRRIYEEVSSFPNCHYEEDLLKAVRLAKKITPAGMACVLSPAAASYGYFKDFEERGDVFRKLVLEETTTLVFTGDIGFDHYMDRKWEDEDLISDEVLAYLHAADHVIANVEGPLSRQDKNVRDNSVLALMHTMDPEVTKVLRKMHADIWVINNNHIMDAGETGLRDTLKEAQACNARTIGAGLNIREAARPLILDRAGGIGMLAVGYQRACRPAGPEKAGCLSWSEMDLIRETIARIRQECRWCIVISHGGEEFTSLPTPYTRDRYLKYLEMGADVVICHHPHVPMNYERVGEKVIFYSLGNFIFDTDYQRSQFHTDEGMLMKLEFSENGFSFEPFGIRILRGEERIVKGDIPRIFRNVPAEEYEKLAPLAAKMFVAATKRQQIFLNPEKYTHATEEEWHENFFAPMRSGCVPGETLDFTIVCPLADQAEEGTWKESTLEDIKEYILEQM